MKDTHASPDAQGRPEGLANNSVGSSRRSGPDVPGGAEDAAERVKSPDQQIPTAGKRHESGKTRDSDKDAANKGADEEGQAR